MLESTKTRSTQSIGRVVHFDNVTDVIVLLYLVLYELRSYACR